MIWTNCRESRVKCAFYVHDDDSPTMIIPNIKDEEFDEKPKEKRVKWASF